jgi:hypothetical protein
MSARNKRRHERKAFSATVRVGWRDKAGNDKVALTRVFDISESGIRFEIPEPLATRSDVMLRADKIALQSRAVVRFCECRGLKYVVGAEFAGGYRWSAPNEEILAAMHSAHMLSMQGVAVASVPALPTA